MSLVFLDIEAGGNSLGRLTIELFDKTVPETCKNFRFLCTREKGFGFKGCEWYRIIPGFCACSGDFETQNADRKGGKSALGTKYFKDENFVIKHDARGILSMDNFGWPDTNSSRFFVTFKATPWMNNFHVAFGKLVKGFETLDKMEKLGILDGEFLVSYNPSPFQRVVFSAGERFKKLLSPTVVCFKSSSINMRKN